MNRRGTSFLAALLTLAFSVCANADHADRIQPYAKNPRYWQFKSQPVLLLGGSKTDHIFLIEDLKQHLDEIQAVGANYVRCTMSQREGPDLKPHRRRSDGKFDLDLWNEAYWNRFADCLKWCEERDIILQIEIWDRFDYTDARKWTNWQESPWRPANNVNYTYQQTGFQKTYQDHPGKDKHPFFHTVPGLPLYRKQYDLIRRYQEKFVDKMLSCSLQSPNVLYCMNNETSSPALWGQYWIKFVRNRAATAGVEVYVSDMFDDGFKPESSSKIRIALEKPQTYSFLDISQVNSRNFNQDHWDKLQWYDREIRKHPRPLNHTKIYSDGQTSFGSGTPVDGVERFWRNLVAGSASSRFHRPTSGIGLNETAQACIRAARNAESVMKFWDIEPHMELLSDREKDEAYLRAKPGEQYLLYFTQGGSVGLDLQNHKSMFEVRWIDIERGEWGDATRLSGEGVVTIAAPTPSPWAAVITRHD